MTSIYQLITNFASLILLIVNVPTAEPPVLRGRLKEHGESDHEVRGFSDAGKLKRRKYISFDVIKYIRFHKIIFLSFNQIFYRKELR